MKREIRLFINLEIIMIVIALYFAVTVNHYNILAIRWKNNFGTYDKFKPIGICVFVMCLLFRYYFKTRRKKLQNELDIYEKFLND